MTLVAVLTVCNGLPVQGATRLAQAPSARGGAGRAIDRAVVAPALAMVACLLSSFALAVTDDPHLGGRAGLATYAAAAVVALSATTFCLGLGCP